MKVKGSHATRLGFNGVCSSQTLSLWAITNMFAIAGFQKCCCCMRWSKEPAHCQTMAAEDRLLNAFPFGWFGTFIWSSWIIAYEVMHTQTLSIISQAQRRCPVFWRRRFLELKLVLIWRRPAVCCPSVTVSLVCTGWGMFRPKRWWSSPPVWRCVSKGSRRPDDWCSASCTRYTWDLALIGSSCILL